MHCVGVEWLEREKGFKALTEILMKPEAAERACSIEILHA